MGCDMVVALGRATVDGGTLFGHNTAAADCGAVSLVHVPGRAYAPGEVVRARYLAIPQVRQTFTVLGSRVPPVWGFEHGVNDQGVAAGCTRYRPKLHAVSPGLLGSELVLLVLERSHSAAHGVDVLTDLLERHGQGAFPGCQPEDEADHAFLIADRGEAFLIETASRHWVYQQILEVRAASNLSTIRQDWNRISPGLGQYAIGKGWWPADGSKLNFAEALSSNPVGEASALRRWGRATLLLEQQNGHIDAHFLRRLLGDHYEGTHFEVDPLSPQEGPQTLCEHGQSGTTTAASSIVRLPPADGVIVVEYAVGPPCLSVYLPSIVEAEQPPAHLRERPDSLNLRGRLALLLKHVQADPEFAQRAREQFAHLQARIDQHLDDWLADSKARGTVGDRERWRQAAAALMQHSVEDLEATLATLLPRRLPQERLAAVSGQHIQG